MIQNRGICLMKVAGGKIRRKTSTIPFGYVLDTEDEKHLSPIPEELQALDQALTYAKSCGWRKASQWLLAKTDRYISDEGLKKRSKLGAYLSE
jgi:hypothetical protein